MTTAFFTQKSPSKPLNSHVCGILEAENARLLVIIRGDDMLPCGWKAAQTAWQILESATSTHFNADAVSQTIAQVPAHIGEWYGLCEGATAWFTAVLVQSNGQIQCWKQDDSTAIFRYDGTNGLYETEHPQDHGKLLGQQGILLLNKGMLHHPAHPFLPDLADWFLSSDPHSNSTALVRKYAEGNDEDLAALMLKF